MHGWGWSDRGRVDCEHLFVEWGRSVSVGWYFKEMGDKAEQNADLLTKHAFENDVDTFVRETLQNANDARLDDHDGPVEVYYWFTRLRGEELVQFLRELDWRPDDETGLYEHLTAAGENEDDRQLDKFLRQIRESEELLLLSVEDRYTEGLPGSETEDGTNYTALIRDMGRSNKDETQGGSHGVGKTVLWAFSGLSTVLFTSTPYDPSADIVPPRFIGRSLLPDHRDDSGQLYSGNGWYGRVDPEDPDGRYVSVWDERDVASERARTLNTVQGTIERDGETEVTTDGRAPGTTATVLGFRDPTEEVNPDDDMTYDDLADQFERTVARYFWPAIEHGNLEVHIRGPDEDESTLVEPAKVPEVASFVECFHDRFDTKDKLEERGDVVKGDIKFELPDKDEDEADDTETEEYGYVSVYARKPGPGDDDTHLDEVAIFRGAGMVVDYISMRSAAAYGSSFFGLLLAGEARGWGTAGGPSLSDSQVEELLRTSEPAAHDRWKGYKNTKLSNKYEYGTPTTVERLTGTWLQGKLQSLVKMDDVEDDDEIPALNKKSPPLDVGGGGSRSRPTPSVESSDALDVEVEFCYRDGMWVFEGSLGPNEAGFARWDVSIEIRTIGEYDSETGRIDLGDVIPLDAGITSRIDEGVGHLSGGREASSISIRGESIDLGPFDPYSGRLGRTKLVIEGDVEYGGES